MNKILKSALYTLLVLAIYRLGTYITMPFVNSVIFSPDALFSKDSVFRILTRYSGAQLDNASIFSLGIGPYISASLICNGLFNNLPSLKEKLKLEGNALLEKYTLYATVPIAINSARIVLNSILDGYQVNTSLLYPNTNLKLFYLTGMTCLVSGTMFLVWLSDLLTERGFGNGSSFIISASILSNLPKNLTYIREDGQLTLYLFTALAILMFTMFVETAVRKIPLIYPHKAKYSKIFKSEDSYLPLKANLAGVIPSIFTYQVMGLSGVFTRWVSQKLGVASNSPLLSFAGKFENIVTILMIIGVSYVYMDTYFRPEDISKRLQNKPVGVIEGVRPGQNTKDYIDRSARRMIFMGAIYISLITILTKYLYVFFKFRTTPVLSGTSILIVATSSIDIVNRIGSQISSMLAVKNIFKKAQK